MSVTPHSPTTSVTGREARTQPYTDWEGNRDYFNPEHFQHLELRLQNLMDLGIEADIILFHSNASHNYSSMSRDKDEKLVRYFIARFASFRNIWWSLANEYNYLSKSTEDWDNIGGILYDEDPYNHLRSIHNCDSIYDNTKWWVTHCSLQNYWNHSFDDGRHQRNNSPCAGKPVILDEVRYEGYPDYGDSWGNASGWDLTKWFWIATIDGLYTSHGETMEQQNFRGGGPLHGESPARIKFLKQIIESSPGDTGLVPIDEDIYGANRREDLYLYYYGDNTKSGTQLFDLPDNGKTYQVDIIDTWNMDIYSQGTHQNEVTDDFEAGGEALAIKMEVIN